MKTFSIPSIAFLFWSFLPCLTAQVTKQSYSVSYYAPKQATGEPDVPNNGDSVKAWATLQADTGSEWLKVGYKKAVKVAEIRIRESFTPGAVVRVTAFIDGDEEVVLWEGEDPTRTAPKDFVVRVFDVEVETNR
jgi:hypothetical protein